ncbi:MAG: ZIP family metal transporter [Candidatus Buchananbacteria bacterium]
MSNLIWALLAVALISVMSFSGALALILNDHRLKNFLIYFVSFAAGSMMGAAFFHLLPEVLNSIPPLEAFIAVLVGFSLFFILERFLRWHHCHEESCETHDHLGWLNLIGDGFHNMIDGMIIFASFLGGPVLGIPVTLSIILHEIPQELGDFGVLLYSGFTKKRALFYNLLSACAAFIGVLLGWMFYRQSEMLFSLLLPFAAGGFIYIAASDLIPELHKDRNLTRAVFSYILFILALAFMYLMKILFE